MSATIAVDDLRVGMFIHLDLGWWAHPFALSSFRLTSSDQIATIKSLGVKTLRWSPEKSEAETAPAVGASTPTGAVAAVHGAATATAAAPTAPAVAPAQAIQPAKRMPSALAAQRSAHALCAQQFGEAALSCKTAADQALKQPEAARATTEALTRALLDKMLIHGELCIRVLPEAQADRSTTHALNVAVVSMLMGRVFGFNDAEMIDLGMGALLHDVGKLELPERVRMVEADAPAADQAQYREHVAHGVALGKRMGLPAGALLVLAQHHEMADGTGFPQKLNVDRMSAAARIVALVNRFDNLCDPPLPAHALTPHEALSLLFAQTRWKFDASMLNAFIRMMGVYPPGSVVQLTDDRLGLVTNVNSSRPLKPRVLLYDPAVPADEAVHVNLEQHADLGIRRSLRPQQLPHEALEYLSPRQRVVYFFEPAVSTPQHTEFGQELAA